MSLFFERNIYTKHVMSAKMITSFFLPVVLATARQRVQVSEEPDAVLQLDSPSSSTTSSHSDACVATSSTSFREDGEIIKMSTSGTREDSETSTTNNGSRYGLKSRHKVGYNSTWEAKWPLLQYRKDEGMYCTVRTKHHEHARSMSGVWVSKPCTLLRQDKVQRHAMSDMHKRSEEKEALSSVALATGSI